MPYANINSTISAADLALLLGYFTSIDTKTAFAVNLSKRENNKIVKQLGKKSAEFLLRVQKIAGNNPNLVPAYINLTDLGHFAKVNEIMAQYVGQPYPSRAAIGVASLPRGALVEIDCILYAG